MSMLSIQIDNLRLMARLVREYDYAEISRMLREAADTIESLRERLQAETLGAGEKERDEVYSAGFDNGIKATLQQLDGLLVKTDDAVEIQAWIDRQWEEFES